jgi:hypothetical protein
MAYCTFTDVQLEAGTDTGTAGIAELTQMIARSDSEINDILALKGLSAPTSSSYLKTASIALTIAKIKRRQAQELSRPNSMSLGGDLSFSVSVESEVSALEARAQKAINHYIGSVGGLIGVRLTTGGR